MVVVMKRQCSARHLDDVVRFLDQRGIANCIINGTPNKMVEMFPFGSEFDREALQRIPMVDRVLSDARPILADSRTQDEDTYQIALGDRAAACVGAKKLAVIAGPCSIESEQQVLETAAAVAEAGAVALRGGAFKPRTSPYSFQGHGERGLEILARAREKTGLAIVTEVMCCEQVELVGRYADVLQIGSRNMHNTHLLAEVGRQQKPVLLKRGWSATLEEFLLAAEYVMVGGNRQVILCERGIRTHETYCRNTLALAVVPEIKYRSRLPILVDPSHGTGHTRLVAPMSRAAVACGADGLLIEVHPRPERAWTDGAQSLNLAQFQSLMGELRALAAVCGRSL